MRRRARRVSAREVRHFFELIRMLGEWLAEVEQRQASARQRIEAESAYNRDLPLRRG